MLFQNQGKQYSETTLALDPLPSHVGIHTPSESLPLHMYTGAHTHTLEHFDKMPMKTVSVVLEALWETATLMLWYST